MTAYGIRPLDRAGAAPAAMIAWRQIGAGPGMHVP